MVLQLYVIATLLLTDAACAFTLFQPNCTAPTENVNFVSSPPGRGTMDIVWSCFTVLLTCTWSIQHLSVPDQTKQNEGKKEKPQHWWTRALQNQVFMDKVRFNVLKLKWMGLSLLAPEYILSKALTEYIAAHESRRQFDHKSWTTMHAYFANMRGFVLHFEVAAVPTPLEPCKPSDLERDLQKPNPKGDPPYFPQDIKRAEAIELQHCHEICGVPCKNRDYSAYVRENVVTSSLLINTQYKSPQQADDGKYDEEKDELTDPSMSIRIETNHKAATSGGTADPWLEPLSAQTAANEQEFPGPRTATTPPNSTSGQGFPMPPRVNTISRSLTNDTRVHVTHPAGPPTQLSPLLLRPSSPLPEKETLSPHLPWRGTWALSSLQMHHAYETGIIPSLPSLTADELADRSKGDALIKFLAVLQITWLVVQILARAVQHLAITLLELSVLASAGCAVATYILLWHKPQDVMTPTAVSAPRRLSREQVVRLAARCPVSSLSVHGFWLHGVAVRVMADTVFPSTRGIPIPLPGMHHSPVRLQPYVLGFAGGGGLFGAVHFGAWNFAFPSPVEQWLWRGACLALVTLSLLSMVGYEIAQHVEERSRAVKVLKPVLRALAPLYMLARLFLLVEVFRSLAYAPGSTWVSVE